MFFRNLNTIWNKIQKNVSSKLQTKLLFSFAGIGICAVLLMSFYSFHLTKKALLHRTFEQLTSIREAKRLNLEEFINNKLDGVELCTESILSKQILRELQENPNIEINEKPINVFMRGGDYNTYSIIFDTANSCLGHFTDDRIKFTNKIPAEIQKHFNRIYSVLHNSKTSLVFDYINYQNTNLLTLAAPSFHEDGTFWAVVVLTIRLESIDEIMVTNKDFQGLGTTGETYLVGEDGCMRSTSRFVSGSVMKTQTSTKEALLALDGYNNTFITKDYRGISVLSSFSPVNIPGLNWAIIAEIDEEEILAPVHDLRSQVLIFSGFILFIFIIVVMWVSRKLSKPLVKLRSLSIDIANGSYGSTISVSTNDEVGQLTEAFNAMSLEIYNQRRELEEKNRRILASITYAKRIQTGLLPSSRLIESLLSESFVLYVPKQIVSGDFYYLGSEQGQIIVAVGDCTGHGVPGAFVSGICLGALQRTIKGFGESKPSLILDRLNEIVSEMFSVSELNIRDGMDISICSIDVQGKTLQYAGANNSLLYIRDGEIHQIKADRQPIGNYVNVQPFKNHELAIQEGDCIYMFSDGYVDQFGGPQEKKFMLSRLKQLLLKIHHKPMVVQKFMLEEALNSWKGGKDQIDDVCVFGARL